MATTQNNAKRLLHAAQEHFTPSICVEQDRDVRKACDFVVLKWWPCRLGDRDRPMVVPYEVNDFDELNDSDFDELKFDMFRHITLALRLNERDATKWRALMERRYNRWYRRLWRGLRRHIQSGGI